MMKIKTADLQNFIRSESDSAVIEVNAYSIGRRFDGGVVLTVQDDGKYLGAFVVGKRFDVAKDSTLIIR